ncbi:MAG: 4-hydroxy-tetrahydrodipicolinate reductase [Archaeoglobaceae archaeon]|nr:4-hydroxy-tetrahydrodipicolinate reductase [Archaeoglobaceae archaeon]MCX8151798.1 4-hydroxy-tetrahydrodipicolinate reductase [Archaeoglobaceae archaeon]MDW8013176.1 4-hydroxy-tetrahydrodipicolinate reductase [Archaeoglobaceae archaeon]
MRIAIAGAAGRMGRLVIKKAIEESLQISQAFDIVRVGEDAGEVAGIKKIGVPISNKIEELDSDILIDFTNPEAALKNAKVAASKKVKIVMGTTGFNELQRKELYETCSKVPSVVSPNFSVGVNVFFKIVEFAAKHLKDYDVEIVEIHHKHKRDSPSGTAIRLAEIINQVSKKRELKFFRLGQRGDEIGIFGVRGGDVVGEHTVFFFGSGERIEIIHRATSRDAFAEGAIRAAKWIFKVEKPGIYTMFDVLGFS